MMIHSTHALIDPWSRFAEPWTYAILRFGYGATLATHGLPKLLESSTVRWWIRCRRRCG